MPNFSIWDENHEKNRIILEKCFYVYLSGALVFQEKKLYMDTN